MKRDVFCLIVITILVLGFQNCAPVHEPKQEQVDASNVLTAEPTYADLQTKLFDQYCVSCHGGTTPVANLDLSNYVAVITSGRVTPGDASTSTLYLRSTDGTMPPSGARPSLDLLNQLRDWINAGAPEDPETGDDPDVPPPPSDDNISPVVDAGEDVQSTIGQAVIVASASDVDGAIEQVNWLQTRGPNQATLIPNGLTLNLDNLIDGQYTFQVTVIDDKGAKGYDTVNVFMQTPQSLEPLFSVLMEKVFTPKCLSCHGNGRKSGNYTMNTYEEVMTAIVPNNSEGSSLYLLVNIGAMPKNLPMLLDEELNAIKAWIDTGALDN